MIRNNQGGSRPRVLLVAFYFYPFSGCGFAMRAVKLAKYLNRMGFEVHVLCGGWESESADLSFAQDLEGVTLHVANPHPLPPSVSDSLARPDHMRLAGRILRSVIPFPDNRFRFLPRMAGEANRIIVDHGIQAMVVTLPPSSTGLLVPMLRPRHPDLPMVIEFRDMWALDPLATPRHWWFRFCQRKLEQWTLNRCDRVVSCTPGFTEWVRSRIRNPERAVTILSGYDEDDFAFPDPPRESGKCVISYAGTTGGVSGPRTLKYIDGALSRVFDRDPSLRSQVLVDIIGHCDGSTLQQIAGFDNRDHFRLKGFMNHGDSLKELAKADILLLNLFDAPGIDIVYPGKTWEYMRLGKPLWIASPRGILHTLVTRTHRLGEWAEFSDPEGLSRALMTLLDHRDDFAGHYEIGKDRYGMYACETLFAEYARMLEELIRQKAGR